MISIFEMRTLLPERYGARATSSFPVPVAPATSTGYGRGATSRTRRYNRPMASLVPIIPGSGSTRSGAGSLISGSLLSRSPASTSPISRRIPFLPTLRRCQEAVSRPPSPATLLPMGARALTFGGRNRLAIAFVLIVEQFP